MPAGAAGAVAAKKKQQKRAKKLQAKAKAKEAAIEEWFKKYDKRCARAAEKIDGPHSMLLHSTSLSRGSVVLVCALSLRSGTGTMSKDEMRDVLTAVKRDTLNDQSAVVNEAILEEVMAYADVSKDGQIEPRHLLAAIKKYKSRMLENEHMGALMAKHDVSKTGDLNREELLAVRHSCSRSVDPLGPVPCLLPSLPCLLTQRSVDRNRAPQLLSEIAPPPHKHADESDVDFLLTQCDKNASGTITHAELPAAVATWMEVSADVKPENEGSSACVLL